MYDISITDAIILGIVQGFTEWLPISSSGHLVIVQSLLGITVPAAFDIVIMAGTIMALIIYFPANPALAGAGNFNGRPCHTSLLFLYCDCRYRDRRDRFFWKNIFQGIVLPAIYRQLPAYRYRYLSDYCIEGETACR